MRRKNFVLTMIVIVCILAIASMAQQASSAVSAPTSANQNVIPRVVNFSGTIADASGKPLTGIAGITFLLYKDSEGGAPLWMETQNVSLSKGGRYSVTLGSTTVEGLPADVFASGEARWLGVQAENQPEQPRVLLVAVPYALKAGDAETIGGLPASAFVLARSASNPVSAARSTAPAAPVAPTSSNSKAPVAPASSDVTTTGGKVNAVPLWTTTTNIQNSALSQSGTGATAKVGIAITSAPAATLDVGGKADVRDTLTLFPKASDNALAINGSAFNVDHTGTVSFVSGQTFPGVPSLSAANIFTNNQTITGAGSAFGLTVAGATYEGLLVTGPEAFIGAGLELETTGTNGMFWQILNTGATSAQKANKLNIRNDTSGLDVMTLLANGQVGIGTTSPSVSAWLEVLAPQNGGSSGLDSNGTNGIVTYGATNPSGENAGGSGIIGVGGHGLAQDADGGIFEGGTGSSFGDGMQAIAGSGGIAGNFSGNVTISGTLTAGVKNFKIDHPLDPANKYLVHASVESSEMMNIYTGNVTTDGQGDAVVQLPEWFEALNTDFRYQLTVIGQFAQAIVASEVQNHEFTIRSSAPNVKVSWQITAVRHDAFAKANPMLVEEEKDARLRGFYLHPNLYGAPAEKQIEWARHPQTMRKLQQGRQKGNPQSPIATSVKP